MEDLDRRGGGAHFHLLLCELIGHAVPVVVELHVIVDVDAVGFPVAILVTCGGLPALREPGEHAPDQPRGNARGGADGCPRPSRAFPRRWVLRRRVRLRGGLTASPPASQVPLRSVAAGRTPQVSCCQTA